MTLYAKVRPTNFDEIIGQPQVVSELKRIISRCKNNNEKLPDMLFMGPPGCGKTTTAYCVAREYLGSNWREYFYEMNASDERGIDVIRGKVKDFLRLKGKRILLLDEGDELTDDAQFALRRPLETSTNTTVIITANNPYKIIQPIRSRCVEFVFKQLQPEEIRRLITTILKKKNIKITATSIDEQKQIVDGLNTLVAESNGDMRKAITILEKLISENKTISTKEILQLKKPELVPEILRTAYSGDFEKAKELMEEAFILDQFNAQTIIKDLYDSIGKDINDRETKIFLFAKLAETEDRVRRGNNAIIQLVGFLANVWVAPRLENKLIQATR